MCQCTGERCQGPVRMKGPMSVRGRLRGLVTGR